MGRAEPETSCIALTNRSEISPAARIYKEIRDAKVCSA